MLITTEVCTGSFDLYTHFQSHWYLQPKKPYNVCIHVTTYNINTYEKH
jgi:hypothetical protein